MPYAKEGNDKAAWFDRVSAEENTILDKVRVVSMTGSSKDFRR